MSPLISWVDVRRNKKGQSVLQTTLSIEPGCFTNWSGGELLLLVPFFVFLGFSFLLLGRFCSFLWLRF